jgi:hypothetical protein
VFLARAALGLAVDREPFRDSEKAVEPVAVLESVATAVEPAEEALAEPFVEQAPAIAAELR